MKPLILFFVVLLSGCQSIVSSSLLNVTSYPYQIQTTQSLMQEFNIEVREFCQTEQTCHPYLFAKAKPNANKLRMHHEVDFTGTPHKTSLDLTRNNTLQFSGSVVLIHGFRGSKEWMLTNAGYFQFLGFDVYIVDLLGHGDNKQDKGFGVHDVTSIASLVEQKINKDKPIIAVGNSMGGLVATYLAQNNIVDQIILQAPMTRFDESLVGYIKDSRSWLSWVLPESAIRAGADLALNKVGLTQTQTNTLSMLQTIESPTLIFASNTDSVSPYSSFESLKSKAVEVVEIDNLEHAYMAMIGELENQRILRWLSKTAVEK